MTTWTQQPAWQRQHRSVGEYTGEIGGHTVTQTLNEIMQFDRVVLVKDGTVTEVDIDSPDMLYVQLDSDGQMIGSDARDGVDVLVDSPLHGWTPLQGHCGAQGEGPKSFIQHSSEFIAGGLEDRILSNPGYYVAVLVDGMEDEPSGDDTLVGWTVLFKDLDTQRTGRNNTGAEV